MYHSKDDKKERTEVFEFRTVVLRDKDVQKFLRDPWVKFTQPKMGFILFNNIVFLWT